MEAPPTPNVFCPPVVATSFGQAARVLKDRSNGGLVVQGRRLGRAPVPPALVGDPLDEYEIDADSGAEFADFVEALDKAEGSLRAITFRHLDWQELREADLERLFGTVLSALGEVTMDESPNHDGWHAPAKWLKILASSIRSDATLKKLTWSGGAFDRDAAQAIADMIRRGPTRLTHLTLAPTSNGGLDNDSLKVICEALPHNARLRHLHVRVREGFGVALKGGPGILSPLAASIVNLVKTQTPDVVRSFFPKSNGPEEEKLLAPSSVAEVFRSLVGALASGNITLTELCVTDPQGRAYEDEALGKVLARNRVLVELEVPEGRSSPPPNRKYPLEMAGLWPHAMVATSRFPAALYRLVRRGAVKQVADRNLAPAPRGANKRGRASSDDGETTTSMNKKSRIDEPTVPVQPTQNPHAPLPTATETAQASAPEPLTQIRSPQVPFQWFSPQLTPMPHDHESAALPDEESSQGDPATSLLTPLGNASPTESQPGRTDEDDERDRIQDLV